MTEQQEKEFEEMKKKVESMAETMVDIAPKVRSIYYAMLGDDILKDGGMVKRLINFEKWIDQIDERIHVLESKVDKWVWERKGVIAAASAFGLVIGYLINIIINILLNKKQ